MRLLRALAHLVLAVALLAAALAPARATASLTNMAAADSGHGGHHASGVQVGHAGHDHGNGTERQPLHTTDTCQSACCYMAAQPASAAPPIAIVAFDCPIRYAEAAQPGFGRADAPEPGIPKPVI